jgi:hypothetical protein
MALSSQTSGLSWSQRNHLAIGYRLWTNSDRDRSTFPVLTSDLSPSGFPLKVDSADAESILFQALPG